MAVAIPPPKPPASVFVQHKAPPRLLHYNDLHELVLQVQRTEVEQINTKIGDFPDILIDPVYTEPQSYSGHIGSFLCNPSPS
jgi:hypothetical protein